MIHYQKKKTRYFEISSCRRGMILTARAQGISFATPAPVQGLHWRRLCALWIDQDETAGSLIISSLQQIIKNEGIRGLYRCLSPTILALLPNWADGCSLVGVGYVR